MPLNDRIGWFAVILIAAMLAPSWPYAAFALVVAVVALRWGRKIALRASERRRLLADCDHQHAEVMAGQVIIPGPVWTGDTPIDPWVDPVTYERAYSRKKCR